MTDAYSKPEACSHDHIRRFCFFHISLCSHRHRIRMMFRGILALCCLTPILTSAEPEGAALGWEDAGCKLLGSMKDVMDCSLTQTDGLLTHVPTGIPVSVVGTLFSSTLIGNPFLFLRSNYDDCIVLSYGLVHCY